MLERRLRPDVGPSRGLVEALGVGVRQVDGLQADDAARCRQWRASCGRHSADASSCVRASPGANIVVSLNALRNSRRTR